LRRILVLRATLLLAAAATAAAQGPLDPSIFADAAAGEPASFLVVLRDQADLSGAASIRDREERLRFVYESLTSQAEASQGNLRASLAARGVAHRPFWITNMIEVSGDRALAEELSLRPEVARIAPNRSFARPPEPALQPEDVTIPSSSLRSSSFTDAQPNVALVGAPLLWDRGITGEGIVIGVADTGISWQHADIRGRYRGVSGQSVAHDYNWHDAIHSASPGNLCGSNASEPCDDNGHGTAVTSLAVGEEGLGVAPGAKWIGCRNMNANVGSPATYTECFQFFLAPTDRAGNNPRPDLAPNIINNSWGCPPSEGCTDPQVLRTVIENVQAAGIAVVVAAGNEGPSCGSVATVPSFYEAAFSIGATTLSDGIASFSSRGPVTIDGSNRLKPDLTAPGVNVLAAVSGGGRATVSGTSAASPHVAGAIALIWSALPQLHGEAVATRFLLQATAAPLLSNQCSVFPFPNPVFGWGRLDVYHAYAAIFVPEHVAPIPPASPDRTPRIIPPRN
jgi:subtilisin family serine protease